MLSFGLCYRIHKDRAGLSKKGKEKIVYCGQNSSKGRLMFSVFLRICSQMPNFDHKLATFLMNLATTSKLQ
jgi:hypothetical protein